MKRKLDNVNAGRFIKAYLYSSQNYMNGKYRAGQLFGLDNLEEIKDSDVFFLETLKVRADSADKMIAEAESQGKDTTDLNVMKDLGEKINALGKPIHRSESIMTAISAILMLTILYGVALGIWGLALKKSILWFGFYGGIAGFLIGLIFVAPVVATQRTKVRIQNVMYGVGGTLGGLGMIIGVFGIVAGIIRAIFF
jgi:hypothetical protein